MLSCPELADCVDGVSESDTEDDDVELAHTHSLSNCANLTLHARLSFVWGPRLGWTTAIVSISFFVANWLYFANLYSFPEILPTLGMKISPAAELFVGGIFSLLGNFASLCTLETFDRKTNLQIGFVLQLLSICMFLHGTCVTTSFSVTEVQVGFLSMKLTIQMLFNCLGIYSAEVYPTVVRATGTAVCFASGRLGAIVCPFMYEFMKHHLRGTGAGEEGQICAGFFVLLCVLTALSSALVQSLPIETRAKS